MRFARTAALVGVGLLWWAVGPLVVLAAAAALVWPPVRAWLRPTRRVVLVWVAVVLVLAGVGVVVPDGRLPIPTGSGAWVTPAYVGRPSAVSGETGPVGASPTLRSRWYGLGDCTTLLPGPTDRLVAVCGGDDPVVRLVDARSLRAVRSAELPGEGCTARAAVHGAALLASSARRVVVLDDDLEVVSSVDLGDALTTDDCVTGLAVDGAGRTWFASRAGVVGVVVRGRVRMVDLDDTVDRPLAVADGAAYAVGRGGLHRVDVRAGRPVVTWTSAYDDGDRGSGPVVLAGGLVAVADNRDTRLQVVVHDAGSGEVVCRTEVFGSGKGATDGGLVAAGRASVVVQNSHGYAGVRSTVLGRTTDRGIARVDVADGDCRVRWTTDMNAPGGAPAVSTGDGLVYAWTKRHSWLGVDAWYLSALDLRTGRLVWARRGGRGWPRNPEGGVTLGPGRAAYVPVVGGIVRVADR